MMESNQKVIKSLLKIVMLCSKQGLALHGYRDDAIDWEVEEKSSNDGNFVQLVRFHLSKSPRNARYTSKTIQNELVSVNGDSIRNDIIDEVKRARLFYVIADEVTDAANRDQGSVRRLCGGG